jgi:ribosomal protein S18 acetylase RimI-like enzyme
VSRLAFRPLVLPDDAAVAIGFVREIFALSFEAGAFDQQFRADGAGYVDWLRGRLAEGADGAALALLDDEIVGLVVIGADPFDSSRGYVFHYCLASEARGRGLAPDLDRHAAAALALRGFASARLSVAEANVRARRFYAAQGWSPAGPRQDQPGVIFMDKALLAHSNSHSEEIP